MDESTEKMILSELQALRAEVNQYVRESAERLSRLDTQMVSLIGNGRPGRVGVLEIAVDRLERYKWWLMGASAAVATVASVILSVLDLAKH